MAYKNRGFDMVAYCLRTIDMFTENGKRPRRKKRVMMHVADAGSGMIRFECLKCNHDTDWIVDEQSVSENRRGMPCPNCNTGAAYER